MKSVLLIVFLHLQFHTQCKARFRFFHPWNSFFSSHTLIRFSRPGRRHYQGRNMNFKRQTFTQTLSNNRQNKISARILSIATIFQYEYEYLLTSNALWASPSAAEKTLCKGAITIVSNL